MTGVALGDRDQGIGGDLEDDRRLGGLGRRRIGALLDHRHSAEDLARPQQLEDDVLARLGCRTIFMRPDLTMQSQRAGSPSMKM